jgi:protein-arginine kinase activator protein McsA
VLISPNAREGQEDKDGICPQCGARFYKVNKQHRFCCATCRDHWHNQQQPQRLRYQGIRKQRQ